MLSKSSNQLPVLPPAQRRIALLEQRLKPATSDELADRLQVMFAGLPMSQAGDAADLRMAAYMIALRDFSNEAVSEAITSVLTGEAGLNPKFAPTPPELALVCRAKEDRTLRELERARRAAEPVPEPITITQDEMRARAERAEKAKALFGSAVDHMDVTPRPRMAR